MGVLRVDLRTEITYGDMKPLRSLSSLTGRGEGKVSESVDWWIVVTGVDPRIPPIPIFNHPNFLSYGDVLSRDATVGDRFNIIRAEGVGFDTKSWMEDWGVDGTNKARAGNAAAVPSQRRRGQ